jgi:hypothetical protein
MIMAKCANNYSTPKILLNISLKDQNDIEPQEMHISDTFIACC